MPVCGRVVVLGELILGQVQLNITWDCAILILFTKLLWVKILDPGTCTETYFCLLSSGVAVPTNAMFSSPVVLSTIDLCAMTMAVIIFLDSYETDLPRG